MDSLHSLISRYGEPDALIDHHDPHSNRYAIWGWDDVFVIPDTEQSVAGLISGYDGVNSLQGRLDLWKNHSEKISAVGWVSYDAKNIFYPNIPFKKTDGEIPVMWFGKPGIVKAYSLDEDVDERPESRSGLQVIPDQISVETYFRDLSTIRTNLEQGNVYQVNYTFPRKFKVTENPFDLYLNLRKSARPANGMFIRTDGLSILSLSPERFIRTTGRHIETFPIKGTRKRCDEPGRDRALAEELQKSEKDRAEHLMIVDLMRNDIGKICSFGSVKVDGLFGIHSFPTVHHMISRVYGLLKPDIRIRDIFKAVFPGGSVTGAPKESAMHIIDELENYSRGMYTGSTGYVTPVGDIDFNIAIRTMTVKNGIGTYPVGGGIVWDSDPVDEWNEAIQKSKILSPLIEDKNEI